MVNNNNNGGIPIINYNEDAVRPQRSANISYLVLAIKKDDEDDHPSQQNEVFHKMRDLYNFLVYNFEIIDLENTKIFSSSPDIDKEGLINLKVFKTAYEMLKYLETIYINEDFRVDDEITENVFYQEATLDLE